MAVTYNTCINLPILEAINRVLYLKYKNNNTEKKWLKK